MSINKNASVLEKKSISSDDFFKVNYLLLKFVDNKLFTRVNCLLLNLILNKLVNNNKHHHFHLNKNSIR